MFSFLSGNKKNDNNAEVRALQKELDALTLRWTTFLSKLEEKYDEVIGAIETEGPKAYAEDPDQFKRGYQRFKSGMDGQLTNIRSKAYDTCESQIRSTYYAKDEGVMAPTHNVLYEWFNHCTELHRSWEERIYQKRERVFEQVEALDDPEVKYQAILQQYASIKHQFKCRQCGGDLTIEKLFFISVYITCPNCQSQNTFDPGAQARMLEHIARPLAEKRNKHLYNEYREHIYEGRHDDIAALTAGKQTEYNYYKKYLRAVFDEIHTLLPDLQPQNELFYLRLLEDYRTYSNCNIKD